MADTVTMTLYSVEAPGKTPPYNQGMFSATNIEQIKQIKEQLTRAAQEGGREPPNIVLSVLLVPDWSKKDNSYENEDYLNAKDVFMSQVEKEFGERIGIKIHDFYVDGQLTENEKIYMHGLVAGGSNADIMKTRAILNNQDVRHLQMDVNTIISDYKGFYNDTLGADLEKQKVALNACLYDIQANYASAHNKVVYTKPDDEFTSKLTENYLNFVDANKENAEVKSKNYIYARVFTGATTELGLTRKIDLGGDRCIHTVNLEREEYRLTKFVVSAINMSWATGPGVVDEAYKKLPKVKVGDAQCDFPSYVYLTKKYSHVLWHSEIGLTDQDPSVREQLMQWSNKAIDLSIIATFYNNTREQDPGKIQKLAQMIHGTREGNALTEELFGCSVQQLHQTPNRRPREEFLAKSPFDQGSYEKTAAGLNRNMFFGHGEVAVVKPKEEIGPDNAPKLSQ